MKTNEKLIMGLSTLIILNAIPISCNEVTNVKSDINVETLIESDEFTEFTNAHINYTMPFVEKMITMDTNEFELYYDDLNQSLNTQKSKQNFEEVVLKMGFTNLSYHDKLYS